MSSNIRKRDKNTFCNIRKIAKNLQNWFGTYENEHRIFHSWESNFQTSTERNPTLHWFCFVVLCAITLTNDFLRLRESTSFFFEFWWASPSIFLLLIGFCDCFDLCFPILLRKALYVKNNFPCCHSLLVSCEKFVFLTNFIPVLILLILLTCLRGSVL